MRTCIIIEPQTERNSSLKQLIIFPPYHIENPSEREFRGVFFCRKKDGIFFCEEEEQAEIKRRSLRQPLVRFALLRRGTGTAAAARARAFDTVALGKRKQKAVHDPGAEIEEMAVEQTC